MRLLARSGIGPHSTVVFHGYTPALGFWQEWHVRADFGVPPRDLTGVRPGCKGTGRAADRGEAGS
jgi:hypothetical protein